MGSTWLQFYADPKNQLGAKDRDQKRSEAKTFPIPDHLLNGQDLRFPIEKDPSKGIVSAFLGLFRPFLGLEEVAQIQSVSYHL